MSDFEKAYKEIVKQSAREVFNEYKNEIQREIEDDPEARERQIKTKRILAKPSVSAAEMAYVLDCTDVFLLSLADDAREGKNDFPFLDVVGRMVRFEPLRVLEFLRTNRTRKAKKKSENQKFF